MNEPREPMHQPPNPDDLRRAPPTSPDCARVRGWLRDFVDRDLDAQRAAELEEHVHRCRTCAVELARTEHETMRLRSALAELPGAHASLPPEFAARVVERLVLDETSLVPKDALARAAAQANAQAAALEGDALVPETGESRIGESQAGSRASLGAGRTRIQPAVLLLASVALLWVLTLGVEIFGELFQGPRHEGRLLVVSATQAFNGDRRLGMGDGLGENQLLRVDRRGRAKLEWHDPTTKSQPAAVLSVRGESEVSLVNGQPRIHGEVEIETSRPVSVTLSDGSCLVDLGVGDYIVSAELHDDAQSQSLPELRVKVEVRSGEQASILRSGFGPTLVAAGELGVFQGSSPTQIVTMGGVADVAVASVPPRQRNDEAVVPPSLLIAHTIDQTGNPVPNATARLRGGRSHAVNASVDIGGDGMVALQLNSRLDTDFMMVSALPPEDRDELGVLAADAYRVVSQGPNQALLEPLQFRFSNPFYGQIQDENNLACEGVRVVPCIVDDLFGAVQPLLDRCVTSDMFGGFRCLQLPAKLPPHQSLRLLLLREDLVPTVITIPERTGLVATLPFPTIVAAHTTAVSLQQLPAHSAVEILEEIPSLPEGTAFIRRAATTDATGAVASLLVGGGGTRQLWWRDAAAGHNMLRPLSLSIGTSSFYRPTTGDAVAFATKFGPTAPILDSRVELVTTSRYDSIADAGEGTVPSVLEFTDSFGYPVVAQVFVVDPVSSRGRVNAHFAGFTVGDGVVTVRRRAEQSVFAIALDGTCMAVSAQNMSAGTMQMPANGRVILQASLRPGPGGPSLVVLRFRLMSALVPGQDVMTTRFAAATTGWEVRDLVPGVYDITIGSVLYPGVIVPPGDFVVLHP